MRVVDPFLAEVKRCQRQAWLYLVLTAICLIGAFALLPDEPAGPGLEQIAHAVRDKFSFFFFLAAACSLVVASVAAVRWQKLTHE
jgi:hypothetical protein